MYIWSGVTQKGSAIGVSEHRRYVRARKKKTKTNICTDFKSGRRPFKCRLDDIDNAPIGPSTRFERARSNWPGLPSLILFSTFNYTHKHTHAHTQWTVPTTFCCQSTKQTAENKRRWAARPSVYRVRNEAISTCMERNCVSTHWDTFLCICCHTALKKKKSAEDTQSNIYQTSTE